MNGFEKRAQQKKQQILTATFTLMNTKTGVADLTINAIATQANVSKATIFKYFGTKEQLIHEIFKQFIERLYREARALIAQNKSFTETFIALSQNKMRLLDTVKQQFYIDLMTYLTEKEDSELSRLNQVYTAESLNLMLDLFHRGRKEGAVDLKYSDEFLMLYFDALIEGISSPRIYERIRPYTAEWTEMLLKGVAPNKARKPTTDELALAELKAAPPTEQP
ncbi:TetR/AcrR family transcriptional regulator [Loigolactobacillus jiayinensis]|uniref:TetR/AcrR family transcriptional regulator n=1 Tax=Loigolactobacillus jiayinensis TaxID=2486016 RepID=A0ABW1RGD9_9LACO|nr:TetR/AcrR family transcriptional regulator [Loigolactobacillus jiayinensis]